MRSFTAAAVFSAPAIGPALYGPAVARPAPVRIDDLASPTYPPEIAALRESIVPMAEGIRLEPGFVLDEARSETGLADFGDPGFEERLDVLLRSFREEARLSPFGVINSHGLIVQLLKNRLLLQDLLRRHPEIHDVQIERPIVIAGLPRTGTTHLHNLLAADPALRSLPYWESLEPFPSAAEVGVVPDPRRERTDGAVWFMNEAMPLFPLMHEMTTDHVHEEIQLLANDFSTMFFESVAFVPRWAEHYRAHDQTSSYRYLYTSLQALQHLRGGDRWLLKSPQHLEQFPVLATVFPDATVVVTHRDPVSVVISMATMVAYTTRMHACPVDAARAGRYWADRIEAMLAACVRDRDVLPADRSTDVRFDDFMRDDLAVAANVYELAGQPMSTGARAAMAGYLGWHHRGRLGRIDYRAADVGLDEAELAGRFTAYVDRFLAPR
jgi:hypothetical protein